MKTINKRKTATVAEITDARITPEVAQQMSGAIPHVVIAPLKEGSGLENVEN